MKKTLLSLLLLCAGMSKAQTLVPTLFAQGFTNPTEIVNAGDTRLFVVQQNGQIKILNATGTTNATPFLNISSLLSTGSERGLLGLAFHPQYITNGYFYINYTATNGNTVIARYTRNATNPDLADPTTALIILSVPQPYSNHNGGCIRFGPDGYLYIGMGDGGSGGDPQNYAQNNTSLLGKMLRLDVNSGSPYGIPPTNAFVGVAGADEIWATGLRNPWKFSFNRLNGDLWIADVGQNAIEEINKVAAGTPAGLNFGWRCYEANAVYNGNGCLGISNYTMPFAQYPQSGGACSVTGGYVYTGSLFPNLVGKFVFADYCNDKIGYVNADGTITFSAALSNVGYTTFGQDINGELYVAGNGAGRIYKVTDTSPLNVPDFTKSNFTVYPNPANDVVNIKKGTGNTFASHARIFDLSGKLLMEKTLEDAETNSVATNSLPAGFYLMQITDINGVGSSHKLTIE